MLQKPIIFLAFANDREDIANYLKYLPQESEGVKDALKVNPKGEGKNYILIKETRLTSDKLVKIFLDASVKNEIAIWHYGGHSDNFQLLLEDSNKGNANAHGKGLIEFFKNAKRDYQQNLHLIFLNGCTNEQLAQELKNFIPVVIGTTFEIDDDLAAEFATFFYYALANGHSIQVAFNAAKSKQYIDKGDTLRGNYRNNTEESTTEPWQIYYNKEEDLEWKIAPIKSSHKPQDLTTYMPRLNKPEDIIGRDDFLEELREMLEKDQKVVVVNGMGGLGKTSVAQLYLTKYQNDYAHLLWTTYADDFTQSVLTAKGLPKNLDVPEGLKGEELFTEIIRRLKAIEDQPNLWVIDNADAALHQYFNYLPKPPNWHILATSREKIERFHAKDLNFLGEEDALLLFEKHCQRITDKEAIRAILKTIDYHTLTIEILAKATQRNDTPLEKLKQAIENDLKAGIHISHNGDKVERVTSYLLSIFDLSPLNEEEQRLLKHFAALPTDFVPYDLLKNLIPADKDGIAGTLNDLTDKGWLLHQAQPEAYKMHRIVQEVVKRKLSPTINDLEGLIEKIANLLYIDDTQDNPIHKFFYIAYGEAVLALFPNDTDPAISYLQNNLAINLKNFGSYRKAKDLFKRVIYSNEVNFGKHDRRTTASYSNLATTLQALGDYQTAKSLLEMALQFDEAYFGENDPITAIRYSNLAAVLSDLGDHQYAKVLLEKAINVAKTHFGENNPKTAIRYSNLAGILKELGDIQGAKELFEKALRINEAHFDKTNPILAASYSNLATALQELGEYEKAAQLLKEAIILDEKNFGTNHAITAIRYSNLASVLYDLGDYLIAKNLLEKAVLIHETIFGEHNPTTATSYSNLAMVLKAIGEYQQALILVFKAYRVMADAFEEHHFYHQRAIHNLSAIEAKMLQNGWTKEQIEQLISKELG